MLNRCSGSPGGTYFYKLVAVDRAGNASAASGEGAGTVAADPALPQAQFTTPTPASLSTLGGTVTLAANASGPTPPSSTVSYGFDPAGFRRSRTVGSQTTRFLLGGLVETTPTGAITGFDVDGPAGDLAHYASAPSSAVNPSYVYYSGHGDLAAEADQSGTRTRLLRLDPWGQPLAPPGGGDLQELYTGRWDKKHDQVTSLIEMGARPYDPALGRFLSVDPVDGGALNEYDYTLQDPVSLYDLDGQCICVNKRISQTRRFLGEHKRDIAVGAAIVGAAVIVVAAPELAPVVAPALYRVSVAATPAVVASAKLGSTDSVGGFCPVGREE